MASGRFRAPDFDYRQPRRHEEHVDSSRQHHACAHRPGEQGRCGNYGWIITNCCRVGRLQGYPGRSGQGIERRLTLCSAANRPPHDRQQYRRNDYSTTPLIIAILGTQAMPGNRRAQLQRLIPKTSGLSSIYSSLLISSLGNRWMSKDGETSYSATSAPA